MPLLSGDSKFTPQAAQYSTPILTRILYLAAGLTVAASVLQFVMSTGQPLGAIVIRAVLGLGAALVLGGIGQLVEYLGQAAHAAERSRQLLELVHLTLMRQEFAQKAAEEARAIQAARSPD